MAKYYREARNYGIKKERWKEYAYDKLHYDFEKCLRGLEAKLNTITSSRGDTAFVTFSFGCIDNEREDYNMMQADICKYLLQTRINGHGRGKAPAVFPKLVYLYASKNHTKDYQKEVFELALKCSSRCMYPDFLSLDAGEVGDIYQRTGKAVSPMGSVSGDHEIKYEYKGVRGESSFQGLWEKFTKVYGYVPEKQINMGEHDLFISPEDFTVYDSSTGGYVGVRFITRNVCGDWRTVTLENGYQLVCTHDHPLQTSRGRVMVVDMNETDEVWVNNHKSKSKVKSIVKVDCGERYGYDLTTATDKFDVSGICSHNCRAFLSDYKDENGESYFTGRANIGAVSLNLPMIWKKSDGKDFWKDLDYYLEMIREFHKKRYEYIADMPASTNPLCFCEGGIHGGNKKPWEKIGIDLLRQFTASFGITALNELNVLMEGKPLHLSDRRKVNDVVDYILAKINQFKKDDSFSYALYGTPAESLCFSGDTVVQTYNNNKEIKDIKVGDLVYSYNENANKIELKPVVRSMLTNASAKVCKVKFTNGQEIVCTPNHPFACRKIIHNDGGHYVKEVIEYVEAKNLKPNQRIKSNYVKVENGRKVFTTHQNHIVESVEYLDTEIPVYDIEVEDNHNFYVGGDDGILVHNCGTQLKQFRRTFGVIEGVSDHEYFTNSFHCHVSADITPFEKQDNEYELFHKCNGGHIQYVKMNNPDNIDALREVILRGMKMGFYQGINFSDITCMDCGWHASKPVEECLVCKSKNLLRIERCCGYLSIHSYRGDTRLNDAKLCEIADRISM